MEPRFIRWIYLLLTCFWLAVILWQFRAGEETRTKLRRDLRDRAEDISHAIAVAIRADGRFNAVPQRRVDAMLEELTSSTNLHSVSLRDIEGNITAQAGPDPQINFEGVPQEVSLWREDNAVFVTLVALGGPPTAPDEGPERRERPHGPHGDGPGAHPGRDQMDRLGDLLQRRGPEGDRGWKPIPPEIVAELKGFMHGNPLTQDEVEKIVVLLSGPFKESNLRAAVTKAIVGKVFSRERLEDLQFILSQDVGRRLPRGGPGPRWDERDHAALLDKRGVHAFVLEVPATETYAAEARDVQLRALLVLLVTAVCFAMAYLSHTIRRSASLGMQLVRAEALTTHLQELNIAAAGLVHETKNPLNLIRGQAQMIGREEGLDARSRDTALKIVEEADRVAGRLNQFLGYSRPLNPAWGELSLVTLVHDLVALLESDREEKEITITIALDGVDTVWADGALLRQVLFNLLLNAIEAVPDHGHIAVEAGTDPTAWIHVRDNGPGVPEDLHETLFQPYVTGTATGTGLGLTIVRQIAFAHGWALSHEKNAEGGATFRIAGLERVQ